MKLVPRLELKLASIDDLLAGRCGKVAPGDVFAFNGISNVDAFIQEATDSAISHVGIVIRETDQAPLSLLEATGKGITATPLAEVLEGYRPDHTCFYLPLAPPSRALVVPAVLTDYYLSNALDKYNYDGVVEAGLYDLDHPFFDRLLTHFHENSPVARVAGWWEELVNEAHKISDRGLRRDPGLPPSLLLTAGLGGAPGDEGGRGPASGPAGGPGGGLLVRHLRRGLPAQRRGAHAGPLPLGRRASPASSRHARTVTNGRGNRRLR